jgi:hypothetical protein
MQAGLSFNLHLLSIHKGGPPSQHDSMVPAHTTQQVLSFGGVAMSLSGLGL